MFVTQTIQLALVYLKEFILQSVDIKVQLIILGLNAFLSLFKYGLVDSDTIGLELTRFLFLCHGNIAGAVCVNSVK